MGARLLAAIDRLRKAPWVVLVLLLASFVGALAQFTGAAKSLADLVWPHTDPRDELAKLGIPFTPAAMAKAAGDGDPRAVGLLLDAGMPVEAGPDPAVPPLMLAAQAGSAATVQRLLAAGADPAREGSAGSALDYAVRYGHPEIVRLLLDRPLPQPVIADALTTAGEVGKTDAIAPIAARLLDKPAAAGVALHALVDDASHGPRAAQAVAALAALHPALNLLDANGQTLLHIAVNNDAPPVLAALLKAGADPDVRGRCHTPPEAPLLVPLACAAVRGSEEGLASAKALVAAHADIAAKGPDGATPLMRAAGNGDPAMTAFLLSAGADPRARDASGRTALDHARAAQFNDPQATIALLTSR